MPIKRFKYLILFGSNSGDRKVFIDQAREELGSIGRIEEISKFYESNSSNNSDQNNFLHQAIVYNCHFMPIRMLLELKELEMRMGISEKADTLEPIKISMDILMEENSTFQNDHLETPHPELHQNKFALEPAAEIAGEWIHQKLNKSNRELFVG